MFQRYKKMHTKLKIKMTLNQGLPRLTLGGHGLARATNFNRGTCLAGAGAKKFYPGHCPGGPRLFQKLA